MGQFPQVPVYAVREINLGREVQKQSRPAVDRRVLDTHIYDNWHGQMCLDAWKHTRKQFNLDTTHANDLARQCGMKPGGCFVSC